LRRVCREQIREEESQLSVPSWMGAEEDDRVIDTLISDPANDVLREERMRRERAETYRPFPTTAVVTGIVLGSATAIAVMQQAFWQLDYELARPVSVLSFFVFPPLGGFVGWLIRR